MLLVQFGRERILSISAIEKTDFTLSSSIKVSVRFNKFIR